MDKLTKRAEELDNMRSKHISEKLTLEEAQNIVYVWGVYLEHSGGLRFLFGTSIPESVLPYPVEILQGAINKMEAFYYEQGLQDRVKLLEETEMMLIDYLNDEEAIEETISKFSNKKWQEAILPALREFQENQMQNGFLVADKKLWKLSESRVKELRE